MTTLGNYSVDIDSLWFKTGSGTATIPDIRAYDESGEAQAFGASGANGSLTITTTLTSLKDLYNAAFAPRSYASDMHERCIRGLVSGLVTGADVQVFHGDKGSVALPDWTIPAGDRLVVGYVPSEVLSYVSPRSSYSWVGTATLANMPPPQSRLWLPWLAAYTQQNIDACLLTRTTNIYVSTSGSDAADGLTPATAFQTLARVNTFIDASSGDVRVNVRRGDVFSITPTGSAPNLYLRGIYSQKGNFTTADYTDEGATGTARTRLPIISLFVPIGSGDWTADGTHTNSFRTDVIPALSGAVNSVAWFRESLCVNPDRVFVRRNSAASVNSNPGSFYYDAAAGRLWMRPHLNGPGPTGGWHAGYEYVPQWARSDFRAATAPGESGVDVLPAIYWGNVDDVRIHNIRIDGWLPTWNDTSTHVAAQAIAGRFDGTKRAAVTNCEGYYSAQHIFMKRDTGSAGGLIFGRGNRTGLHFEQEAGAGRQVQDQLMSYSSVGGNVGVFADCECIGGRLPSETYNDHSGQGEYIRNHTDGATESALCVAWRCRVLPHQWQPANFGTFAHVPNWISAGGLEHCRAFKVDCSFDVRPPTATDVTHWSGSANCVYGNIWDGAGTVAHVGGYHMTRNVRASSSTPSAYTGNTYHTLINTHWVIDLGLTNADSVQLGLSGANPIRWYFPRIDIIQAGHSGGSAPMFSMGSASAAGDTWANSAQGLKSVGALFNLIGLQTLDDVVVSGLGNNLDSGGAILAAGTERVVAPAYVGGWSSKGATTNFWGFCNEPRAVTASRVDERPTLDSPLVIAGAPPLVEGRVLEYDAMLRLRRASAVTIGPVQAMSLADQVSGGA